MNNISQREMNFPFIILKKTLFYMKVFFFILLASLQFVSASSLAQKISLSVTNGKMEDVFKNIANQSQYKFLYNDEVLTKASNITLNVKNASLDEVLKQILDSEVYDYKIMANTVLISMVPVNKKSNEIQNQTRASGVVVDENGKTISNVSIIVVGSTTASMTDKDGKFQVQANVGNILEARYLGYKNARVTISSLNNIRIVLVSDESSIEEVQVVATGYQNLNPKLFTGSSVALKGKDVIQEGVTDLSRALEGRAAGVAIQNVSGTFGAAPKVRIRGASSLTGDNKPLWVIDGVILEDVVNISNDQLTSGDASTLIGSSVAGLNMDDIEDINILKDAAATAQYGARAMNGVIVIRTKKGRVGKTQVSYTGNFSLNPKPDYKSYNIMNSVDQMSVYSQLMDYGWFNHSGASRSENGGVFRKMYDLIYDYDSNSGQFGLENTPEARETFLKRYALANTDWFDILFNNSLQQEHSVNFNGGSETAQTYFSTSYLKDNGWAKGNDVERWTANLNNTFKLSDRLSVNFITTGAIRNQMAPGTVTRTSNPVEGKYSRDFDINPFSYALNTSRTMTAYDENGELEFFTRNFAPFNVLHELENNRMRLNMLDLKLQGGLTYKILKGLDFSTLGSMRYAKSGQEHMVTGSSNMAEAYRAGLEDSDTRSRNRFLYRNPADAAAEPVTVLPVGGFYNTNDDFMKSYTFRNSLDYNFKSGDDHEFNAFLAQEIRINRRQNKTNIGYGYQYDKGGVPFIDPLAIELSVANNIPYYSMRNMHDRASNFLGRFAYAYKNRYSVNATMRYDGSNQLGNTATARWLPTWNISGAWRLSNESFYEGSAISNVINKLSVRGTYGLVANINGATSAALMVKSGSSLRPYKFENETLMNIIHLANDELTWEKSYEANLGFDFGFMNDKFALALDFYNRNSFDLIYEMRTPAIGGEYRKNVNYADMNNKGAEFSLSYNGNIGNVKLNSNFNFGYSVNKVTKMNANPIIFELVGTNGGPTLNNAYRGLYSIQFTGLDAEKGFPLFMGEDGETKFVDPQGYNYSILKYEGPTEPKFAGGYSNTLSYKNFSLFTLFTFATGNKIRLNPYFNTSYADTDALPNEFKLRWILDGDNYVPALVDRQTSIDISGTYPYNSYNYSTERVASGDLLKLKTVRISYNLPDTWLSKYKVRNSSLSLVANNFWLIYADKKLNGQDPEFFNTGGVALPVNRMYTLSFKFGF